MAPDETHFFDRSYGADHQTYFDQFQNATSEIALGEKTASYLYSPEVPYRIWETLGDVKLIINLRDPILRLHSIYQRSALKSKHLPSFVQMASPDSQWVNGSLYGEHMARFLKIFEKDQILVSYYEDMQSDPVRFLSRIYAFLGIESGFISPSTFLRTKRGLFEKQRPLLNMLSRPVFHPRSPLILRRVYSKFRPEDVPKQPSYEEIRTLQPLFQSDIRLLENLTGRDLGFWLSKS